jgi:uncharacterized protein YndB with AHSA1/START domain
MGNRNQPIVVEEVFNASVVSVWDAITVPEQMKLWFFNNISAFEPVVGFETSFMVISDDRRFTHQWEIIDVVPNKSIKYNWSYKEYEGAGFVTFELSEKGDSIILRLTNEGLASFPSEIPEFSRANCEKGWEFFLKQRLKEYIDKL